MKKNQDKGFTLVELLIVIVILGILSAVVVVSVGGVRGSAQKRACEVEYRALVTAVETYRAAEGSYPASEADLVDKYIKTQSTMWDYATATGGYAINAATPAKCSIDSNGVITEAS